MNAKLKLSVASTAVILGILGGSCVVRRASRPNLKPSTRETERSLSQTQPARTKAIVQLLFSDARTALLLDNKGTLLKTADSGKSWAPIGGEIPKEFDAFDIVGFKGLAVGHEGRIWKTDDAGLTWYVVSKLSYPSPNDDYYMGASQIILNQRGRCFILDTFAIWNSWNDGVSWHQVEDLSATEYPGRIREISFLDSRNGWAISDGGLIFRTIDSGEHWRPSNGNLSFDRGTTPETIRFLDEKHGWLAVFDAPQPYPEKVVLFTADGGMTWRPQPEINYRITIHQIFFLGQHGWMAGGESRLPNRDMGILFVSKDGGQTWQAVETIPKGDAVKWVQFFSDSEGWISTENEVYRTEDSGKTWSKVLSYPQG